MRMRPINDVPFSYFYLKLGSFLSEYHPERMEDKEFITARADEALTTYCDAVAQGFSHPEAESMASEVLYRGLHFSRYEMLISVLENEFEEEFSAPLSQELLLLLLANKALQATFAKYDLTDVWTTAWQYDRLYTELTGTMVLLLEQKERAVVKSRSKQSE